VQALADRLDDPGHGPHARSFRRCIFAAHAVATWFVNCTRVNPAHMEASWLSWSYSFSAAFILAALAAYRPHVAQATDALAVAERVIACYETSAARGVGRARQGLVSLLPDCGTKADSTAARAQADPCQGSGSYADTDPGAMSERH
jgi:hypothetical protein